MANDTPSAPKRSGVEVTKENSQQLRGTISLELAKDSDGFSDGDKNLIKFHGSYQQEDRDARKNRKSGGGKLHNFMVRCKIPGGHVTSAQYLVLDQLADKYANGTIRVTTRQGIQFHGILKKNLKPTIAEINRSLLTTLGACGDVQRNVMAPAAPDASSGVRAQLQATALQLAIQLAPRTRAYHEIWLDGEKIGGEHSPELDVEPLYGKVYLPRKFKTALALPDDNSVDIYAQDLGFLAHIEQGQIVGYNVLVGGGMGMTHGNAATFPYLAKPICYIPAAAVVPVAEAVVRLFRDHGNRADRKRARIKYVVHDWGVPKFKSVLEEYVGGKLLEPKAIEVTGFDTYIGWHPQGDGRFWYGLHIENGRIKDAGSFKLRSALRAIIARWQPTLRLTPLQDVLLCDLPEQAHAEIQKVLQAHGVALPESISQVQQHSMACPAIPTCGLAISESERALPGLIDQLEATLKNLGLEHEKLAVRMTGCPNGCARPYQSDIGLVGRSGEKYSLFVGGHVLGHRLSYMLLDLVPLPDVLAVLTPLLTDFKKQRGPKESFGDYCHRLGADSLRKLAPSGIGKAPEAEGHEE